MVKTIITRLLFISLVIGTSPVAASATVKPHVATYDVRLGAVTGPEAPQQVNGSLVYLIQDRCDGFIQESTLDLTIQQRGASPIRYQQSFSSFEHHDQSESTFSVTITAGGGVVDSYTGAIERADDEMVMIYVRRERDDGENGSQTYTTGSDAYLSLAYTAKVAEQAANGTRFVSHVVADGLLDDGPNRLSSVIGPRLEVKPEYVDPDGVLVGTPWPVNIAYFPESSSSELPSQEMRILLYPGGIVGEIDQNAGDYTVITSLVDLQAAPACTD